MLFFGFFLAAARTKWESKNRAVVSLYMHIGLLSMYIQYIYSYTVLVYSLFKEEITI